MARCRVAMEKLPPYRNAVVYRVLDDIDYVIPSFEVLRVRLHRCIFAVIQDDGSEGELIEGFINSATIRGQIWPRVIVPLESCDILVNSTISSSLCYKIDFLCRQRLLWTTNIKTHSQTSAATTFP